VPRAVFALLHINSLKPIICAGFIFVRTGLYQTVQHCIEQALAYGPIAAIDDLPLPGRWSSMNIEAKGMEDDVLPARRTHEHEPGKEIPQVRN
jgi:hypothetical protein